MFVKYQHLERYGTQETENILDGYAYIFPKIDGTNGSIWWDKDRLHFGSRNRELDLENDNAGFMNTLHKDQRLVDFFKDYPDYRLYGEWLVPHSLKTYKQDAWRKFYVFDVYVSDEQPLLYEEYKKILDQYEIEYIPPICILKNGSEENLYTALDKCGMFLVEDGKGLGEGIVIKNYDWKNKYGRQTWAKLITSEFKMRHHIEMGAPIVSGSKLVEEDIVNEFVTEAFVLKEKVKIEVELGGWESRHIPRLLGTVFYELIKEEMWNIVKKYKNPKINFGLLNKMTIDKTKKTIGL